MRLGVVSYFVSACLARGADAGAIIGIVLLANQVAPKTPIGGLLAACLTAPHLAGPFVANILDRSSNRKGVLACAFALYAVALGGAALLLTHHLIPLAAIAATLAGACGPLLTGGLSSQLTTIVPTTGSAQRRAHGLDAFTYGVASTGGPALIAAVAGTAGPMIAVLSAAGLAVVATAVLLLLPSAVNARADTTQPVLTVPQSLALLFHTDSLRRVAVGTALSAMPTGAIPLLALAFALDHHGTAVQGAILVTADGVGTLLGSTIATVRPPGGDPDRVIRWWTLAVAIGLVLCALSPNVLVAAGAFLLTGTVAAIQFAVSLAARANYSPPTARAQIFVTMAGLKVACSALGVALIGLATGVSSIWLLLAGAGVVLIGAAYMAIDALSRSQSR